MSTSFEALSAMFLFIVTSQIEKLNKIVPYIILIATFFGGQIVELFMCINYKMVVIKNLLKKLRRIVSLQKLS